MKIQSLLNPFDCGSRHVERNSESPAPASVPRTASSWASLPKRSRPPKDAAIFSDAAKVNGPVNFPAYEVEDDEELAAHHREFRVNPIGDIMKTGARRIPYNSDKKDFMPKTGRDAFEVFQYEFSLPGEEKVYNVLWDYQVGLVRVTPFFKCCKYSKTTPARVLNLNPGLRDICYSITGGALAAQGYWMPFEAAEAVAATFCYNVRYALTPIFGKNFLNMCIHPKDSGFAKFTIDPVIVHRCTHETSRWRQEGLTYNPAVIEDVLPVVTVRKTPQMKFACSSWGMKAAKTQRTKTADEESGYGTDEDFGEKILLSPEVSPRSNTWTSVNRLQSPRSQPIISPPQRWLTSVPSEIQGEQPRRKRTLSKATYSEIGREGSPVVVSSKVGSDEDTGAGGRHSKKELGAAEILLDMSVADNVLHRHKRTRRDLEC